MRLPEISVPHFKTKLPSNNQEIKYRPYLVKEEKVLLMALQSEGENRQADVTDAVRNLIKSCIITEDVNIDKLPSFDLEWIFLKIRAKSVGEIVEPRLRIPKEECGKQLDNCVLDAKANLDALEVRRDPKHSDKIMLTDTVGMMFTYPNAEMATRFSINTDDPKAIAAILDLIAECVVKVFDAEHVWTKDKYDKPDQWLADVRNMIENLTRENMEKVRQFFFTMPKIIAKVETKCPRCNKIVKREVEGLLDFFI